MTDSTSALETIEKAIDENRLAHALLLCGNDADGLKRTALSLAAKLLETDHPATHPDLLTLAPVGKARQIRIGKNNSENNSVRSLIHNINLSPVLSPRKVAIVDEVDRMNKASANAFLKTLEEPPDNTNLFLLTTRPYDLLATIQSRCLLFRIPSDNIKVQHDQWQEWLEDYSKWVTTLLTEGATSKNAADFIIAAYGLSTRFSAILTEVNKQHWDEMIEETTLPEDDDQVDAMQVGHMKMLRSRMLAELEQETRDVTCQNSKLLNQQNLAKLARSVAELEHSARLLELNFNADASLEHFLLRSLQIWTR